MGITQFVEDPNRTKGRREGEFALFEPRHLSSAALGHGCCWFSGFPGRLGVGLTLPAFLILQLADGTSWDSSAPISVWANTYNNTLSARLNFPSHCFTLPPLMQWRPSGITEHQLNWHAFCSVNTHHTTPTSSFRPRCCPGKRLFLHIRASKPTHQGLTPTPSWSPWTEECLTSVSMEHLSAPFLQLLQCHPPAYVLSPIGPKAFQGQRPCLIRHGRTHSVEPCTLCMRHSKMYELS